MGDCRKCQTSTASPAKPGGLPVMLVGALGGRKCSGDFADCDAEALRNKRSSLAKTCSIGFRSGEHFGRKKSLAPAARMS